MVPECRSVTTWTGKSVVACRLLGMHQSRAADLSILGSDNADRDSPVNKGLDIACSSWW